MTAISSPITGANTKTNAMCLGHNTTGNLPVTELSELETLTGITFKAVMVFVNPMPTWADWVAPWPFTGGLNWNSWVASDNPDNQIILGMDLVPWSATGTTVAPVPDPYTWEAQGAAGDFNTYYTQLAENLVSYGVFVNGQPLIIRLGVEANGNWEADWVGSTSEEQTAWAQTFANCVTSMRAVEGANFLFVWNPNAGYSVGTTDLSSWYPGNDYVDIIGIDIYDQDATNDDTVAEEGWSTFWGNGTPSPASIVAFANTQGKPIAICEWGLESGEDPAYINGIGGIVSGNSCAFQSYFDTGGDGILPLSTSYPESLAAYIAQFGSGGGGGGAGVTEDASTPDVATSPGGTADTTLESASFSPPADSLLLAMAVINYSDLPGTFPPDITVTDSAGGTWTAGPAESLDAAYSAGAFFTRPVSSAPGSITVTMSRGSDTEAAELMLAVRVLDGAAASQSGAGHNTASGTFGSSGTADIEGLITSTQAGSAVYVLADWSDNHAPTPLSGLTTIQATYDSTDGGYLAVGSQDPYATVTPGSETLGWSATITSGDGWIWAALEILPSAVIPSAQGPLLALGF